MTSAAPKRIYELDGLRALAITLVIGCHYAPFSTLLGGLPKFGWIGVDIFFALSGYLITTILLRLKDRPQAFRTFYVRRCQRILPPLAVFFLLLSVTCVVTGDYQLFTGRSLLKHLLFLQAFGNPKPIIEALASPALVSLHAAPLPLAADGIAGPASSATSVLWSLSIEEYFYLLWAPVVLWCRRRTVVIIAVGACLVELFIRWFAFTGRADYFSIFYRFDALLYGALAAMAIQHFRPSVLVVRWAGWVLLTCMASLGIVFVAIRPFVGREIRSSPLFMTIGLPLFCVAAASLVVILVARSGSHNPVFRLLRSDPLRAIGTVSYMLYLLHVLVYVVAIRAFGQSLMVAIASAAVATALAALSWRYLEQPILTAKTVWLPFSQRRHLAPTAGPLQEQTVE